MAGRVFYIDPLHGSSANNGLTSAAYATGGTGPFGSLYDVLWGGDADPDKFGGSGDTYYLVGSTADILTVYWDGGVTGANSYNLYTTRWQPGSSDFIDVCKPAKFIGVNTNLEEDGTQYDIQWYINVGPPQTYGFAMFFTQRQNGEVFKNIKWTPRGDPAYNGRLGGMRSYTSGGGGPYLVNCTFDWTNPDALDDFNPTIWNDRNPSASFFNCTFLGPSGNGAKAINVASQYGQHGYLVGCKFRNFNIAYEYEGQPDPCYGNIFEDCNYGIYVSNSSSSNSPWVVANNLFYNIANDAIYISETGTGNVPIVQNNLFVDIGGYAIESTATWNPSRYYMWCFRRNVIQNATSGPVGVNIASLKNGIFNGFTGDGVYGNISDNVVITGLTLSIDSDFGVTISGFPSSALGLSGGYGVGSRSSGAGFLTSGVSGESEGAVSEPEQARVTS